MKSRRLWPAASVAIIAMLVVAFASSESAVREGAAGSERAAGMTLPMPVFHHIHINSVSPERSLEWYTNYWPKGTKTTFAGFPAFYDDIYLLYTKVGVQARGAFDRKLERSVPQSAFWTFGSTFEGTNTNALRDRISKLDPKQFQLVTLYGGPDGKQSALHSLALPMGDQLLTGTAIKQRSEQEKQKPRPAPTAGLDFAYLVDPDGMLVEVTAGKADSFRGHTHFWGERPLCTANWHVEHLGAEFPPTPNTFNTGLTFRGGKWDPCDVPTGEVTYPTYMRPGQLRIPAGNARIANAGWLWYPRQCRAGRCGPGNDQPLARSRGQVVDHIGLTYPDLDAVIAHLKTKKVPILDGPYRFADTRAILIEDLDGLAFELIEARN